MLRNLLFQVAQKTLNAEVRRRVEGYLVTTALVLFGLHLALYGAHAIWGLGLPDSLFAHPLQTLYTPFSVILIAEVYLLVYYLPTSFARSLGKQIEIVALIEIRSVFKDLDTTSSWALGCRVLSAHALRPGSRRHAGAVLPFAPEAKSTD